MNRKDLINYINNKKWIKGQIENYIEQKTIAEELKAVVIDGMPKAKDKPNYAVEELLDSYDSIINYLKKQQEKQNEITLQLDKMENATYKLILFYKYIQGLSLEEVAVKIEKDWKYTCNLHGYALNEFDKICEENFSNVEKCG